MKNGCPKSFFFALFKCHYANVHCTLAINHFEITQPLSDLYKKAHFLLSMKRMFKLVGYVVQTFFVPISSELFCCLVAFYCVDECS